MPDTVLSDSPSEDLKARWQALKAEQPKLRTVDAARKLEVSEAEILNCRVGENVTRLAGDMGDVLKKVPKLGEVMALTRNAHAVHEKYGSYKHVVISPGHAIVNQKEIDLRLFMGNWHYGFAVTEEVPSGVRSSLQFFGLDGKAVHKIYTTDDSEPGAYQAIVEAHRMDDDDAADAALRIAPKKPAKMDPPDDSVDLPSFRAHWEALQDTHDFIGLLQEFGVGRHQALRLIGEDFAYRLDPSAIRLALEGAAQQGVSIMCFVGNPGCIQIHTGPIHKTGPSGNWFNIFDERFHLHLDQGAIDSLWLVRKPTREGIVTALEAFDTENQHWIQFFGERKPGRGELSEWRALVEGLPRAPS